MMGKVCMKVGHGTLLGAEHGAKPKKAQIFDFSNFLNFPFIQILTHFSSKMGYFYGF